MDELKQILDDLFLNIMRLETYNNTLDYKLDEIDNSKQVDELRAFTYAIDREKKDINNKIDDIYRLLHKL